MKTKKSTSFWVVVWFAAGCLAVTAWRAPEQLPGVVATALAGVVAAAATYQGANVADNWQRSKNYREELDREAR